MVFSLLAERLLWSLHGLEAHLQMVPEHSGLFGYAASGWDERVDLEGVIWR